VVFAQVINQQREQTRDTYLTYLGRKVMSLLILIYNQTK